MPNRDDASIYIALEMANGRDGNNASNEMERNEAAVYAAMGMDKENRAMELTEFSSPIIEDEFCQ